MELRKERSKIAKRRTSVYILSSLKSVALFLFSVVRWVWVQVEMYRASPTLRRNVVATARSLVSCFSHFLHWKNLWRNLNYHLCPVRNMWTKYVYYFQGLRALKCRLTKRSNSMNYRSKLPRHLDFQSLWPPPPSHENFQNPISREGGGGVGVDFFWNNPLRKQHCFLLCILGWLN